MRVWVFNYWKTEPLTPLDMIIRFLNVILKLNNGEYDIGNLSKFHTVYLIRHYKIGIAIDEIKFTSIIYKVLLCTNCKENLNIEVQVLLDYFGYSIQICENTRFWELHYMPIGLKALQCRN